MVRRPHIRSRFRTAKVVPSFARNALGYRHARAKQFRFKKGECIEALAHRQSQRIDANRYFRRSVCKVMDLTIGRPTTLLRDQVVVKLRMAIVAGHYKPGQRLLERELCDSLNVSRTSVREALRQLEIEQLVSVGSRGRPAVATMSSDIATEIYEFRIVLEQAAVGLFIERAPPEAFEAMRLLSKRFAEALETGEVDERLEIKTDFYDILFTYAGNPSMKTVFVQLFNRIGFLRSRSLRQQGNAKIRASEFDEIVELIARRETQAAQLAIEQHVASVRDIALRYLNELGV